MFKTKEGELDELDEEEDEAVGEEEADSRAESPETVEEVGERGVEEAD